MKSNVVTSAESDLLNLATKYKIQDTDLMDNQEIQEHLTTLSGWEHKADTLVKDFNFNNFMESMAFANQIAPLAEEMGHHPDLIISYSKVTVSLTTHEAKAVTQKDFDLALKVDQLV